MKATLLVVILISSTACSASQDREAVMLPEGEPSATVEPEEPEPTPDDPTADPTDGPIDLGIEGDYGNVTVEEPRRSKGERSFSKPSDSERDWSCRVAADCRERGLPRPKMLGDWLCTAKKCVFETRTDDIKMF